MARDGRKYIADPITAAVLAEDPDWREVGVDHGRTQLRTRVDSPELALLRGLVDDAVASARAIRAGTLPGSLAGLGVASRHNGITAVAQELLDWSKSERPFGLVWIAQVIESQTGTNIQPERIAERIALLVGDRLRRFYRTESRQAVIVPVAA